MIAPTFHYYPPNATRALGHRMWVHPSPVFLDALWSYLTTRHTSRFPEYRFEVKDGAIWAQVWIGAEQKAFLPGEYQPEFDKILTGCMGFEAAWSVRDQMDAPRISSPSPAPLG